MEPLPNTILDTIHDVIPQSSKSSVILAGVQRLEEMGQKAVDEWRAENSENRTSAVFGSSSLELEDLSKMFND